MGLRSWTIVWLIPLTLIALGVLLIVRNKRVPLGTVLEYWVYLPEAKLPESEEIMTRMVRDSPFKKGIGTREGILFTDIRLHVGLATREKNAIQFRPDLLFDYLDLSPELLSLLAEAQAFARIRYVSPEPLPDRRHLLFIPHMASAICHLGQGLVVLDQTKEVAWTAADFDRWLHENGSQEEFEPNVRICEDAGLEGQIVFGSKGLGKIGLPEIRMIPAAWDFRTLLQEVTLVAAEMIWREGKVPDKLRLEAFGDPFELAFLPPKNGVSHFRVSRADQLPTGQ